MIDTLTLRRPDDWHVHFRDGPMLRQVAPWTTRQFARAIVMPNLVPPVTTSVAAREYRDRIMAALRSSSAPANTPTLSSPASGGGLGRGRAAEGEDESADFTPLMTC